MSHIVRCDSCPAEVVTVPGHSCDEDCAHAAWLLVTDAKPETPWLNFCSWACAGAYTTARALLGEGMTWHDDKGDRSGE